HSWAVPFWCAALPPLLAMSRCLLRSIDANPRSSLATRFLPQCCVQHSGCNRCATELCNSQNRKHLGKCFPLAALQTSPRVENLVRSTAKRQRVSVLGRGKRTA